MRDHLNNCMYFFSSLNCQWFKSPTTQCVRTPTAAWMYLGCVGKCLSWFVAIGFTCSVYVNKLLKQNQRFWQTLLKRVQNEILANWNVQFHGLLVREYGEEQWIPLTMHITNQQSPTFPDKRINQYPNPIFRYFELYKCFPNQPFLFAAGQHHNLDQWFSMTSWWDYPLNDSGNCCAPNTTTIDFGMGVAVSRFHCKSEYFEFELCLDVNIDVYPLKASPIFICKYICMC